MIMKISFDKIAPARFKPAALAVLVLFCIVLARAGLAQQGSQADSAKSAQAQPASSASPAEGFQWGAYQGRSEIEIGYRSVTTAGNKDMYRGMVNLGEGPKLLRSDISLRSNYGTGVLFDRLDFSMYGWGGDPYNTLRFNIGRSDLYDFRATYRNLNYYNFIPALANPLIGAALNPAAGTLVPYALPLLGQHSLNVTYRTTEVELRLFPNSKVKPFVGYSRYSSAGPGFSTYSVTGNEFLLRRNWNYSSDEYRGGVQFSLPRLNLTLEQGYRFFRNDSGAVDAGAPNGNFPVPFIGQKIVLNTLDRAYRDRTKAPVSRILAKFDPVKWLSITGRYIYSMADVDSDMVQLSSGNLVSLDDRIIYASAADSFTGRATRPMHRGNLLAEFSPISRLTILNNFDNRNFHVSGDAVLASTFFNVRSLAGPGGAANQLSVADTPAARLNFKQVRNETEADYDLGAGFVARAGYRYSSTDVDLIDRDGDEIDSRSDHSKQDTAIVGLHYRQARWLYLAFAYEYNWTNQPLTRTDLLNYGQTNMDVRIGPWKNLSVDGHVSILSNENRAPDINLDSQYRNYTVALNYDWGERINLSLDYGRTRISSDMGILIPQTLTPDSSFYRENTDGLGGSFGVDVYKGARVDFGYRGILSTGLFPLNYHQPFATVLIPVQKHFALKTYWQYYGYNEKGTSLQDYRAHLVTFAIVYRY